MRKEIATAIETLNYMKEQNPQLKSFDVAIEALNRQLKEMDILDKIRAEIKSLSNANPSYWHSGDMIERDEVLDIIGKYRESEGK